MDKMPAKRPSTHRRSIFEILVTSARVFVGSECADRLTQLTQNGVDWDLLNLRAGAHGMSPLLYATLRTHCESDVPPAVFKQLRQFHELNKLRNTFLASQLCRLLEQWKSHGITGVPYKGPALASCVYGDLALRQAGDLDILLPKQHIHKAEELMTPLGYRSRYAETRSLEETLERDYELRLVRDEGNILAGLHWRISPKSLEFDFDNMGVWDRLHSFPFQGNQVLTFAPEDLLVLLSVHGTKDLWIRLIWLCDLAMVIRQHKDMDWDVAMRRAAESGGKRMLLLGLGLTHALLEVALPNEVTEAIQDDPLLPALISDVRARLFDGLEGMPGFAVRHLFYLKVRERLRDRLSVYRGLVYHYEWMTPGNVDRAFWQLPTWCGGLYYCLWPLRFAGKFGVEPLRILRHQIGSEQVPVDGTESTQRT